VTTDSKNKYIRNIKSSFEKDLHKLRRNQLTFNDKSLVEEYKSIKDNKDMRGIINVFNWTDNKYQNLKTDEISYMLPLAKILNNPGRETI